VLGGWLIEHLSWRAVFFINLPLALLVIAISVWRVPESKAKKIRVSTVGRHSRRSGIGRVGLWLIESSRLGFSNPAIWMALASGIVVLALFPCRRSEKFASDVAAWAFQFAFFCRRESAPLSSSTVRSAERCFFCP
jgi:MFS family permease